MPAPPQNQPSARPRPGSAVPHPLRVFSGSRRYVVDFAIEVMLFWLTLAGFQILGYGGHQGGLANLPIGLLLVGVAIGAGEARFRVYRRVWAVAGLDDAIALGLAIAEATLLVTVANLMIPGDYRPFRLLVPLLAAPAVFLVVGLFRIAPRLAKSGRRSGNRLLVVVSGPRWHATFKGLMQTANPEWSPIAIVTTSRSDLHQTVMGVPVLGHSDDLQHWMEVTRADGVAFVLDSQNPNAPKDLYARCLTAERPIFIVPGLEDWFHRQDGARLRQLSADDLVGRETRDLEVELTGEIIRGRTVLVTGAAGSIGAELCRLLVLLRPRRLILLDNNESGLFEIAEEVRLSGTTEIREVLVSILDTRELQAIFTREGPDIVFHAAAYKHVSMLEIHPEQAVMVNVIGTRNTMRAAETAGTRYFALISTDKATARHSVMGCTKRLGELMILSHQGPMSCWAVRFGNVVGSRGSVVPIFERQIAKGGPVTITHPDVTRYMMTIREAAALVISSTRFATPGHLYMLDMGDPIKIHTLALALIRSRGLRPGSDINIVFTGLRPGELLNENLLLPEEGVRSTGHPAIMDVVSPAISGSEELDWIVDRLHQQVRDGRRDELVRLLRKSVRSEPSGQTLVDEGEPAWQPDLSSVWLDDQ